MHLWSIITLLHEIVPENMMVAKLVKKFRIFYKT